MSAVRAQLPRLLRSRFATPPRLRAKRCFEGRPTSAPVPATRQHSCPPAHTPGDGLSEDHPYTTAPTPRTPTDPSPTCTAPKRADSAPRTPAVPSPGTSNVPHVAETESRANSTSTAVQNPLITPLGSTNEPTSHKIAENSITLPSTTLTSDSDPPQPTPSTLSPPTTISQLAHTLTPTSHTISPSSLGSLDIPPPPPQLCPLVHL